MIKFVTPLVLGVMFLQNLVQNLFTRYEGYPLSALLLIGWGSFILVFFRFYLLLS